LRICVPVWHLHVLDHLAQLFPEHQFVVWGTGRLGDFGYPHATNIYQVFRPWNEVKYEQFDLLLDAAEAENWTPNYFEVTRHIRMPRVISVTYSRTPHHLDYYKEFEEYPKVFEDTETMKIWNMKNSHVIYHCPLLFYNAKWLGNETKLFTVYNYYKRNRLFSKDEEFYVQLEKHLPLVVHDGSIDFISEEELVKKYATHRCFVDGSVERRMTNAFLQALALGMPCIVVKSTHDNNKMVIDKKSGFIVSNVEEAIERGRVLLEDKNLAEEFHNVALQVREDFINPNMCKKNWTELFEEALVIGP